MERTATEREYDAMSVGAQHDLTTKPYRDFYLQIDFKWLNGRLTGPAGQAGIVPRETKDGALLTFVERVGRDQIVYRLDKIENIDAAVPHIRSYERYWGPDSDNVSEAIKEKDLIRELEEELRLQEAAGKAVCRLPITELDNTDRKNLHVGEFLRRTSTGKSRKSKPPDDMEIG